MPQVEPQHHRSLPIHPVKAAIVLAALVLWAHASDAAPPSFNGERRPFAILTPAEPAPITPFHTARGGVTNLTRYRGKVVLLNIWATWCEACLYEMPALDRLAAARNGKDFQVVTVSVDDGDRERVLGYLKKLNIRNLPAHMDPAGRVVRAFGAREGLPWTFIIDRLGRTRGYLMGAADWESAAAGKLLDYYISRK